MKNNRSVLLTGFLAFAMMLSSVSFAVARDEGMYTLDKLASLDLRKKGMRIKPEEIYDPKGGGLSEAIVRLESGCSAEFVSPKGLILTNHHCAYDALVTASSPQNDIAENGFTAMNPGQEIEAKGFAIDIPERSDDVTAIIKRGTENLSGGALAAAIKKNTDDLLASEKAKAPAGSTVIIQALNNGFFYYLYQTKRISDIRIVYAPPRNIGIFGGDPDNFEWTRHTGDFTFLRAYVAPDGSSADYSQNNVPYQPKRFLTINAGGLKENDFTFVMGYPGGTTRYRESQSIEFARDVNFPFLAEWLEARSNALRLAGESDDEKRIAFLSDIANFDNSNKVFDEGRWRLRRANVVERRRAEEQQFAKWVEADPARKAKYGNVLSELAEVSAASNKMAERDVIVRRIPEQMMTIFGQIFMAVSNQKQLNDSERKEMRDKIAKALVGREPVYEREMLKYFLKALAELPDGQKIEAVESLFEGKSGAERRAAEAEFAASLAEGDYWNADTLAALYGPQTMEFRPERDQPRSLAMGIFNARREAVERSNVFASRIDLLRLLYQQGMAEMKKITPYPDANFTLRFTYGNVKGFSPREAEYRTPFTTIKGMHEKDRGVAPWDMPQSLKDLQAAKDFGRWGSGDSVVVNFISTNDIIGGNSGSPVLNANGEQVGLVFDGNIEGLGNDFFYDIDKNRTISVDIRFVLFVTEKVAKAGWILDEMKIVGVK